MTGGAARGPELYALLGWPVEHSLSPALHAAAFRELGIDAVYVPLAVREEELAGVMHATGRSGGGNVTVPHKRAAAAELDRPSEEVLRTGACNCYWLDDGELAGDNTDVGGFRAAVEAWPEVALEGSRILLLGAGGAARAVVAACRASGAGSVEIWNRTTARARKLVEETGPGAGAASTSLRVLSSRSEASGAFDLVVNATSLGLDPEDPLPMELGPLDVGAAFDLVYGPGGTRWTEHARTVGVPSRDGLEMLVQQAGLSLRRWLGVEPPLDRMRAAARSAADRGEC